MAVLISCATGNMSAAATWALADATSLLDSQANTVALGTTYVESAAFTPGAITIDGLAVKLSFKGAGGANTITVRLALGGADVAGTPTTISVSDLAASGNTTDDAGGWYLFKFAAPVTLAAATAYTLSVKMNSSTTAVNLWRDGTANNFARMLRTTTTQAPAAGDTLHVLGEHTGAGTGNNFTVTMDSTATTDYGPGTDGSPAMTVGKRGTLTYGASASTNYYLKLSGDLIVYSGGTLNIGTTGTPIPRTSTAVLEFDPVASGGMGLCIRSGGTCTMQGLSRTSGKNVVSCLLNANAAAAATTLNVDSDTGWLNGDDIAIAATSRTGSESEGRTLNADAGASSMTISAGLTNAHSGTSPTQGEVILLSRNVILRSADSAKMTYVQIGTTSNGSDVSVDIDWARFRYCGTATVLKNGMTVTLVSGAVGVNVQYSSWDGLTGQLYSSYSVSSTNGCVFSNNVAWLGAGNTNAAGNSCFDIGTYTAGADFSGNVIIGANTGGRGLIRDCRFTFNNNRIVGLNGAPLITLINTISPGWKIPSWSGNVIHSCAIGITLQGPYGGTISNLSLWRCGGSHNLYQMVDVVFDHLVAFGNVASNITLQNSGFMTLTSPIIAGDSTFSTATGINLLDAARSNFRIIDGQFGVASGIYVAHTGSDIGIGSGSYAPEMTLHNTVLGSTVELATQSNLWGEGRVSSQKNDGTVGSHKTWKKYGTITVDATVGLYRTSSPSERLTPNNAAGKLKSAVKRFAVANGATATVSVYIRESVVGDGTDYNGNRSRLILKANPAAGIAADTVLATATVASVGAFELLSGTTAAVTDDAVLEVYVDCDGTTGWVNCDDWSVS